MSPTTGTDAALASQQSALPIVRAVVCYLRTANPGTVGQRHLQRQRARLQAACADQGWTVAAWVEDLHQSGATLTRPGLHRALALLAGHHADALLATDTTAPGRRQRGHPPAQGAGRPAGLAAPDRQPHPDVHRGPGRHDGGPRPGRGGARR